MIVLIFQIRIGLMNTKISNRNISLVVKKKGRE
jgi:hypothetical protein